MRIYVSNDSYPELREIVSRWQRHLTWWRAFRSGAGDPRLWSFAAVQGAVFVVAWWVAAPGQGGEVVALAALVAAVLVNGLLTVTWGGDLIRPHLRKVSASARDACPRCGHLLTSHRRTDTAICCPECGADVPRSLFEPPYRIPREFRAL